MRMKRSGWGVLVFLLISLMANPNPIASQDLSDQTTYISPSTGINVTYGEEWLVEDEVVAVSPGIDHLVLRRDATNLIIDAGSVDIAASLGFWQDEYELDVFDVGEVYGIWTLEHEGIPYLVFSTVITDHVETLIAPTSSFVDGMISAQTDVAIDGYIAFPGLDAPAMADFLPTLESPTDAPALLVAAAPTATPSPAATMAMPSPTVTPNPTLAPDPTATPSPTAPPIPTATPSPTVAPSPTATPSPAPTSEPTLPAATMVVMDDRTPDIVATPVGTPSEPDAGVNVVTYVGPHYSQEFNWDASWQPTLKPDQSLRLPPSSPYRADQIDGFCLVSTGEASSKYCTMVRRASSDDTPANWQFRFAIGGKSGRYGTPIVALSIEENSFAFVEYGVNGEAHFTHAQLVDGLIITQDISSSLTAIPDAVDVVQSTITYNGSRVLTDVDAERLRIETADISGNLADLREQQVENSAVLGLENNRRFKSYAMSCDVSWSEDLVLDTSGTASVRESSILNVQQAEHLIRTENFRLMAADYDMAFDVSCLSYLTNTGQLYEFGEGISLIKRGRYGEYAIQDRGDQRYRVTIALSFANGSGVLVQIEADRDQLERLPDDMLASTLIVNGVNVGDILRFDEVLTDLP